LARKRAKFWVHPTKTALVDYTRTTTDPLPQLSPHPIAHLLLNVPLPPCDPQPVLLYCPHDDVSSCGSATSHESTAASRPVLTSSSLTLQLTSSSKVLPSPSSPSQFEKVCENFIIIGTVSG